MDQLGTLITIADKVFKLLQSPVLKNMKDWESNLTKLNKSVSFIKDMLLDAEAKPKLSRVEQRWVDELNEVLYEADDLFDEVITIAKMNELDGGAKFSKKVIDKVSRFFSSKNRILVSYNTSQEVKSIQQKLDAIARDHARYDFKVDPQATLNRKVETTCSFLDETHENIIGRENDVKDVVDMLLDPNVEENVEFVVIVGIGGLGKTTLARLVYNHDRVGSRFEKKLWTCVSDQDGKGLDVQAILGNIIESSTNENPSNVSTMQSMQTKLQEELKNKTYLLILDDVWTEDPNEWSKLKRYLTIGGRGSKVVITTRSEKTAEVVLGKATHSKKYMLKGLSDDDSWRLFVLTAFERESDEANDPKLTKIGQKIVKKCSNVPLAIKVLGTLLYGQTHRWESFESTRLPQFETTKNPIMSILKLSYNNLEPSVKNCFRYCALFPKDFEMKKRELIYLWMAQGYIGDNSEDCFLILLKRCFFQDVVKDKYGDIVSFKMHDLMHDLAQEVAGDEIIVLNSPPNKLSKKNRHLFLDGREWTKSSFREGNIRTCYMYREMDLNVVKTLVTRWPNIRSLCIFSPDCTNLSESIGELLHLRHLDLTGCRFLETLPNSIVNLYNLQSLIMIGCERLKGWPKYFSKLVNLKLLDISDCRGLICMPLHMDQLINLRDLSHFRVGGGQLKDLKFLVNLRGELYIEIDRNLVSEKENESEGSYLEPVKILKKVDISYEASYEATILAKLQPNQNLMELGLSGYYGTEIPRWGRAQDDWSFILPNLVTIKLWSCKRLHGLPVLSNLKHLKELSLTWLGNLEYMETGAISRCSSGSKDIQFFPSLEHLSLIRLERLKGWWGRVREGDSSSDMLHWQPPFPRLSTLIIECCPKLTSLPPCPSLEALKVCFIPGEGPGNLDLKLRVEETDVAFKNSSSLLSLVIDGCVTLKSVSGVLDHLTALNSLSLQSFAAQVDYADMPWSSLHNLCSLRLDSLESLEILPTGIKHLTALQNLSISFCVSLKGLPEWISCLQSLHSLIIYYCPKLNSLSTIQYITSLQKLEISHCPHIAEACREPSGTEWPKIRHIPHILRDFKVGNE